MGVRIYLPMFAIACLVVGGCTMPSVTINVDQGQAPPDEVTQPTLESTDSQPAPPLSGEPTRTNTLVVPPQAEGSPAPEAPGAAPGEEPSPIPTALVDPELAALWDYAVALEEEVVQPLKEMGTALDELGLGSGQADIFAVCTGIDVVVATLAEVQQGLAQVGPPPVNDADLQECYAELIAAMDDLEQGFQLLQTACQMKNLGAVLEAANYLESGAQHMDNAAQAMERWQAKVGL